MMHATLKLHNMDILNVSCRVFACNSFVFGHYTSVLFYECCLGGQVKLYFLRLHSGKYLINMATEFLAMIVLRWSKWFFK